MGQRGHKMPWESWYILKEKGHNGDNGDIFKHSDPPLIEKTGAID